LGDHPQRHGRHRGRWAGRTTVETRDSEHPFDKKICTLTFTDHERTFVDAQRPERARPETGWLAVTVAGRSVLGRYTAKLWNGDCAPPTDSAYRYYEQPCTKVARVDLVERREIRVDVVEVIPAKPDVSAPPPQERPIPARQICRPGKGTDLRATVTFKQVNVLDHNGDEPWNIRAFVSPVSKKNQGGDVTLVDEVPIGKGDTRQLGDLPVSVSVGNDEQIEILIQGWQGHRTHTTNDPFLAPMEEFWNYAIGRISDLTPDFLKSKPEFDVITVHVWPNTWDGTRTIKSKNLQVTFGLDWDA
jgi:hypothetical protein